MPLSLFDKGRSIAILAAVVAMVASSACKSDYPATAASGKGSGNAEPRPVQLVPVREQVFGNTVVANGNLAADEQADLSFRVPGRIASIAIDLGSVVGTGAVIARLDTADYELRVQQAEAGLQQIRVRLGLDPTGKSDEVNLERTGTVLQARAVLDEARTSYERSKQLTQSGVISRAQLDTAESAFKVAEARYQDAIEEVRNRQALLLQRKSELALARQQLADTTLRAPFGGSISERVVTVGEYVGAGDRVATLVRLSSLRMQAEIPERAASGIVTGQPVTVTVEGVSQTGTGRVARISPVLKEQTRVLVVEIQVDNTRGHLRPGNFASAEIAIDEGAPTIAVPASTIVSFAGVDKVFVVEEGKAVERIVSTGRRQNDMVEIEKGLATTDSVVADPGTLVSGQVVAVGQ